ncbi:MAG: bifunctional [glutamine synthetase] adenylyltransferase/[glutamine synthetase]-adenylyl-L-tyrosine phosphorylase [Bauldia sp.]|nr:bifunctional [glutamine synthetase] adenylyltransferase/[glutamine synthetase]-adenylyl-L-tyrosine phosphorylase [Bauldia sp.]
MKAPRRGKAGKAGGEGALADRIRPSIRASDARRAKRWLADLDAAAREVGAEAALAPHLADPDRAKFLAAVMDDAPFLRSLMLDDPARLGRLLGASPEAGRDAVIARVAKAWTLAEPEMMAALRQGRAELALLVALADLGGAWDVEAVMAALTAFADAAVGAAASFALTAEHTDGKVRLPDPANPQAGSGWIILAMGKHGAGELNYSSDVDLIVLYDPRILPRGEEVEPGKLFARMTRKVVHLLEEHTADGYVLRTDLRLRPDPGSTPIAISVDAALQYYEDRGQNWERAALIKARPVAGDIAAGEAFLAELSPYIWRKYLDYAAIADIHSIKRQIHDYRGHATVAIEGHNLKLGRGGIREIEFFVQTQQLIAGGRNPELRGRRTVDMLAALASGGWIDAAAAEWLTGAYHALRSVEHRLQMVADEQTHTLPEDPEPLANIAHLMGLAGRDRLAARLRPILEGVEKHYARLFESAPSLGAAGGSLVFTGEDDDPGTVATLAGLGYGDPSAVIRTVRGWHYGRYPAMRSATARERLTELTPALLQALAGTDSADTAFIAFDRFLSRMPAGLQLFSLLGSNPGLLTLFARILGTAPRLADILTRRPHVIDGVLEPAFFGRLPDRATLGERLRLSLTEARGFEDILDRSRVFGQEQGFLIGVRILAGAVTAKQAGAAYADLADVLAAELFARTLAEFEKVHGRLAGGAVVLVAMGKFGGREMTANSDLDLILIYDHAASASASNGAKPLAGSQYYTRLTQRFVAALSAPTAEGALYEVDFRLRPSGNAGPLATRIDAFTEYQTKEAWTWEHMALTRARCVAGAEALKKRVDSAITGILIRPRPKKKLTTDVIEMRALVEEEIGGKGHWDLKQAPGGLVDVEFVAQYLQLLHAHDHLAILSVETEASLAALRDAKLLPRKDADLLVTALRLYQNLHQVLRLCVDEVFDPATAPRELLDFLARIGEAPDFARLDADLVATQRAVREAFERLIGKLTPAEGPAIR